MHALPRFHARRPFVEASKKAASSPPFVRSAASPPLNVNDSPRASIQVLGRSISLSRRHLGRRLKVDLDIFISNRMHGTMTFTRVAWLFLLQ